MSLQHLVAASALVAMPLGLVWLVLGLTPAASDQPIAWADTEQALTAPSPLLDPLVLRFSTLALDGVASEPTGGPLAELWSALRTSLAIELERGTTAVPAGALIDACIRGQPLLVKALLAAGADPNERDEDGIPAISYAASTPCSASVAVILRSLLEAGVSVEVRDQQECTPLWHASDAGNLEAVEFLLSAGARVNARDFHGGTPLHAAARCDEPEVSRLLKAGGADLESIDDDGCTPLLIACQFGTVWMIETLRELGADLHTLDLQRNGALHLAVAESRLHVVYLLLERGVDRERRNAAGETALDHGLLHANLETIEALWTANERRSAAREPDRRQVQRFGLAELQAMAEKWELTEMKVHGFDPVFCDPVEHSTFTRLRIEHSSPSHERCTEKSCAAERGVRWKFGRLADRFDGRWELVLQRDFNDCPRDLRLSGVGCGLGNTRKYELLPHDGQWYVIDLDLGGDQRVRRLPGR
ncbi:MAG: ankyrin repeat domain-containing protein [Planctomycetes bacterium]|nr:ankyrin repeat domain-containing protein [Planctomycetota bacterium]